MYFKISNTAKREVIEKWTDTSFKYPKLYKPQEVINGLNEVTIPLITLEDPQHISLAIWGLLPQKYKDDWTIFQRTVNTLNLHEASMDSKLWYVDSLENRRCVIPVTGFFTAYLKHGESFPYYVGLKNDEPFYLAGIYNTLEDGFITCSLLVGKADGFTRKIQNLVDCMPLTIQKREKDKWLDSKTPMNVIREMLRSPVENDFHANPIAKELFNNDISYDSMLTPYEYPNM